MASPNKFLGMMDRRVSRIPRHSDREVSSCLWAWFLSFLHPFRTTYTIKCTFSPQAMLQCNTWFLTKNLSSSSFLDQCQGVALTLIPSTCFKLNSSSGVTLELTTAIYSLNSTSKRYCFNILLVREGGEQIDNDLLINYLPWHSWWISWPCS
jgi:hypothetical protein